MFGICNVERSKQAASTVTLSGEAGEIVFFILKLKCSQDINAEHLSIVNKVYLI